MAAAEENKATGKNRKRNQRYLPQNKAVKKKGSYPLRPGVGVEGFFITCDGGREHQASREALNVFDTFYEQLVDEDDSGAKYTVAPSKGVNKITKFSDSDASSDDESDPVKGEDPNHENQTNESEETPAKKQRLEAAIKSENVASDKTEKRSVDKLIEAELKELGDRSKRRFVSLDSGCNGVVFVQMLKRDGGPGPAKIVQHMMTSSLSTRKHISRFILRVLPVEVTCYASEEEISKAIKPLIAQYFPEESETPLKFAVLCDSRANTGIEKKAIINCVAKSVSGLHKVDLSNPDKTIVVQIVKTVCLIGVVEKYKELSKYNLRQLTSPQP